MDLALNNLQRLICNKPQPTDQPTTKSYCDFFCCEEIVFFTEVLLMSMTKEN